MKNIKLSIVIVIALICVVSMIACGSDDKGVLRLGLDAEIVEIDADNQWLYVKGMGLDGEYYFGEKQLLDCKKTIETAAILYVNYSAENEVKSIPFGELQVGDAVIIGAYDEELRKSTNNMITVEQVQLSSQRLS